MALNEPQTQTRLTDLVAEELRALLARRRISGRELARRMGESPSWVNFRLTGHTPIGLNDVQRIAEVLGVTVADLLPRSQRAVTNGSSAILADTLTAPHPFEARRDVVRKGNRRTGRTGRSLQRAIAHSHAVV